MSESDGSADFSPDAGEVVGHDMNQVFGMCLFRHGGIDSEISSEFESSFDEEAALLEIAIDPQSLIEIWL